MSVIFGIANDIEIASLEPLDAMPASGDFSSLCNTYRDSVSFVDEDPETAEEYVDQQDAPVAAFIEQKSSVGRFSTPDFSAATLKKLFPAGTVTGSDFAFPMSNPGFETALRFKTDSGHTIAWPRVKLVAKRNMEMLKKGVALIDVTFTPLTAAVMTAPA